jgi:signal transduction histidine kinase
MAVRLDQRDEALRELLAQLAIVNGLALLIASLLGYRFARAALDPVERYRRQAAEITHGAAGVRLDVPPEPQDELTRLGETLNTMIDALERAADRERHFIDDASHELRTPLTALAAEIAIALRKRRTPEEYEATLRRLEGTTAELLELAETLLALGALESAGGSQEPVAVDDLLAVTAQRAASQVDDGRRVQAADVDDLVIRGDRLLLERALGNLADNAIRHGSGDVSFSARATGAPGYVALAVHDDGEMDPDFLPHAAERFRRHDGARGRTGIGLGLALVDAIVHASDGQLRICSNGVHHLQPTRDVKLNRLPCAHPEGGTTVTVIVPADAREDTAADS